MKRIHCYAGIMCLAAVLVLRAGAADRYVVEPGTPGVTPDGNYETWGTAATNIQHAVARAVSGAGETIWVSNGHYRLTNEILVNKSVTIRGFNDDRAGVIVDGNYPFNTNRCFYATVANVKLASMTITNGYAGVTPFYGGGVLLLGTSNSVSNCVVTGNTSPDFGGGVATYNYGEYTIIDSTISGNRVLAEDGGGVYMRRGMVLMTNCIIRDNIATNSGCQGGGFAPSTSATGSMWNCEVINNHAAINGNGGGGIGSRGTFVNCTFISNSSGYYGGLGIAGEVRDCTFAYNRSTFRQGGGLTMSGSGNGLVSNCVFYGNSCNLSCGAGILIRNQAAEIVDCIVSNNTSDCSDGGSALGGGAGIALENATGMVRNCTIRDNRITGPIYTGGAGLYTLGNSTVTSINCRLENNAGLQGGGALVSNAVFRNCLFAGNAATNRGGALHMLGKVQAFNCTIAGNTNVLAGGAAVAGTNAGNSLVNCIAQFNPNLAAGGVSNHQNSAYVSFTNSCTLPLPDLGTGNTDADPLFVNLAQGDYRLGEGSPAADAGVNQPWMIPPADGSTDLDGKPRLDRFTRLADMGCYERVPRGMLFGIR